MSSFSAVSTREWEALAQEHFLPLRVDREPSALSGALQIGFAEAPHAPA
jgi:hypothetical protein